MGIHTKRYKEIDFSGNKEVEIDNRDNKLYRIVDSITETCSKPYFNKVLRRLAHKNPENAKILCDYLIAEQTEVNIKIPQRKVNQKY